MSDADTRLAVVATAAGVTLSGDVKAIPSDSNDAWAVGDTILRVCWRGDPGRLLREAAVVAALPDSVPHAEVLDAGEVDSLTWMRTRRLRGDALSTRWPSLDPSSQRDAIGQVARALRALHAWTPPEGVEEIIRRRPATPDLDSVIGVDLNPLPVDRALRLVPAARALAGVDPGLIDEVADRLAELRHLDPFTHGGDTTVVHGDAHLANVLWHEGRIVALIDFEWARFGPPDLELQAFCRLEGDAPLALAWLIDAYPGLTAHPRWLERLWLYDLAERLRHLVIWPLPPGGPPPPQHPVTRLAEMVGGPDYLRALVEPPSERRAGR